LRSGRIFFHVLRALHFRMKLYNDQRNAQVFNLFIYLLLPSLVLAHLQRQVVQVWLWCQRPGAGDLRLETPYTTRYIRSVHHG
jgi:hypothetical protein